MTQMEHPCHSLHGSLCRSLVAGQINKGTNPPDALIYMTDGFGRVPDSPPPYECLWVVTEKGADQFGFGDVIKLSDI